jgi:hypothetical protein
MNCSEHGDVLTNFGRIWFSIYKCFQTGTIKPKINLLLNIFRIKSKLKILYLNYDPEYDELIRFLNETLKENLISFFEKKGI